MQNKDKNEFPLLLLKKSFKRGKSSHSRFITQFNFSKYSVSASNVFRVHWSKTARRWVQFVRPEGPFLYMCYTHIEWALLRLRCNAVSAILQILFAPCRCCWSLLSIYTDKLNPVDWSSLKIPFIDDTIEKGTSPLSSHLTRMNLCIQVIQATAVILRKWNFLLTKYSFDFKRFLVTVFTYSSISRHL